MDYYQGTHIPTGIGSSEKIVNLIDKALTPRLLTFREITVEDEQAALKADGVTWHVTWGNWLESTDLLVRKNQRICHPSEVTDIDYLNGWFQCGEVELDGHREARDTCHVSYTFDYFPANILEGFLRSAVSVVNTGSGSPTAYTLDNAPPEWENVMVNLAFANCMERLLLDYQLWRHRLAFAVSPADVYGSGSGTVGDLQSMITELKHNAEEIANKTLDNPKLKSPDYTSWPTPAYYRAVRSPFRWNALPGAPFGGFVNGQFRQ